MPPRGDAAPALVRLVEGIDGSLHAVGGPDFVWIDTPVRLVGHERHGASFTVRAGELVPFVLTWQPSHTPSSLRPSIRARRSTTPWRSGLSGPRGAASAARTPTRSSAH
jgi:hypothetical protein